MTRARRALLLASAIAAAGACANVVGVADHKDAIAEFCGKSPCDELPADCAQALGAAIDGATPEEVRAWLETYDEVGCAAADCQIEVFECFYSAPGLCGEAGGGCERSETCCGFDFDAPANGAGCCAAGVCCEGCAPCAAAADAYAQKKPFDEATLCLSQAPAWSDLEACAEAKCKVACGPGSMLDLCKFCLANDCKSTNDACGKAAGF